MTRPRLITHRPEALGLPDWGYRDGWPHLAAWLDVTHAGGGDWHDPDLVLVDVECLDLLDVLYGARQGRTIVLATGAEAARAFAACVLAPQRVDARTDRPRVVASLIRLLEEHARQVGPDPDEGPPRLRLVSGGDGCQAVQGAAR